MSNQNKQLSYSKHKMKVLLLENIHPAAEQAFLDEGYQVESLTQSLDKAELKEKLKDVFILGIRSGTNLTEDVLASAPRLLAIGTFCIGTNQVDLGVAAQRGIAVFNAPFSNTRSVVELALGGMIALARRFVELSNLNRQGSWQKSAENSHELRGKTLGILGYGNIGSQLSVLAENIGMRVVFYDTVEKLALGNAKKLNSMAALFKESDIVSVHVDGRPQNYHLVGEAEFALMKPGALFLNLSRGMVVDEAALFDAVKSSQLGGAFLDVYENEPTGSTAEFTNPLSQLDNVIMTPHIGGATEESQENIGHFVSGKLSQFIDTGSTDLAVNMPALSLPAQHNRHRLIHIHQNVSGVMSAINQLLSDHQVNIEGQYLGTKGEIGYVITDIDTAHQADIVKALKAIPGTIRVRVLY